MTSKAEAAAATHYLQFNIQWASLALLYYDYALTLPSEIKYIWGAKFRLSTVLYVLCRYALAANVIYLLAISHHLGQGDRILGVLSTFGRGAVIVTFTLRTYAIYGSNRWILAYLSTVGLTCFILDFIHVPGLKCVGGSSIQM
ncbi:hypothetical protein PM082_016643 [Marasmius tenuissimus]|nr:hypothetical protein PM082_016643 [Marasmius tenuissimus]